MVIKAIYAVQPYHVGPQNKRSLALIIPAKLVRECGIDSSSIFIIRGNTEMKRITIQTIDINDREQLSNQKIIPLEEGFEASTERAARIH